MRKIIIIIITLVVLFVGAFLINQSVDTDKITDQLVPTEETSQIETTASETTSEAEQTSQDNSSMETEESEETESETSQNSTQEEAEFKPDFQNTKVRDPFGNIVELHDLVDKPSVINIWASWCPPCKEEIPYFQDKYEEFGDQVNFIMLNATNSRPTETVKTANEFIQEYKYTFPVYYDVDMNNMITFKANTLPTTVVINQQGQAEIIYGMISEDKLDQILKDLLP